MPLYHIHQFFYSQIHLSFSQGVIDPKHVELTTLDMQWGFLNLLFKSVGLTLTEIQDCCFRLAYFERQTTFYTQEQLVAEVSSHYTTQVLKVFTIHITISFSR